MPFSFYLPPWRPRSCPVRPRNKLPVRSHVLIFQKIRYSSPTNHPQCDGATDRAEPSTTFVLSPAENVRYETIIDTSDANTMGKENLSTTKESIHQADVSAPAPKEAIVQQKESTAYPAAEEEANIEDSYWLDDQHLNLQMDDSGDNQISNLIIILKRK
ncbi:hypothetical protein BpHYR1_011836 [Brachionus plicatilis]|uniref:Uncharacterized protein n=1 Tax=Brachionus plicatilis TaxID=10195 RepID=A0A3M7Q1J9_BRAPC|nr:hypothetical protein BpHYR1_011836 [Brachionus plicatilis]